MRLFGKSKTQPATGMPDRERACYEIARNAYPTIINQCYREAHTETAYRNLPQTAARKAVEYAERLVGELNIVKTNSTDGGQKA